jgi:hypothetical protein
MRFLSVILFASALLAQTSSYPGALDTNSTLFVAGDNLSTTLTQAAGVGDGSLTVASTAGWTANMIATVCDTQTSAGVCTVWEHTLVTGVSGSQLTVTRAFAGTAAKAHASGLAVAALIDSAHQTALKSAVLNIETLLGVNGSSVATMPVFNAAKYSWQQTPGGSLAIGSNAFTLNPVPAGIATGNSLYISGGAGSAEAVPITGWNAGTGQVIVTCAATHSGAWTAGTASFGMQEAIVAAQNAGGGTVFVGPGSYTLLATVNITASNIWLSGSGIGDGGSGGTIIRRTGDFGDSIYAKGPMQNTRVEGLYIAQTINYSAGPPPTIVNRPTSGAQIHLFNCWECRVRGNSLWNLVYGVEADGVGRTFIDYNEFGSVWDYANANVQVGIAAVYLHHSASSYGYPTYTYVEHNEIINAGYASAARTITVNGNNITSHTDAVGSEYGVWVTSCEVCEISHNSIEWTDYSGVHIAGLASHSVSDALLDILVTDNYFDYNRVASVDFDMTANTATYALNTRVTHNRMGSSGGTLYHVYFAPPASPWTFVRTASKTLIGDNQMFGSIGAAINMLSGGNTEVVGNQITDYNFFNAYPTNSLTCNVSGCTGDRLGSSGIYLQYPALLAAIRNNQIGGSYAGGPYGGGTYTVGGVGIGVYLTNYPGGSITAPNVNTGVQAIASRSPAVPYDPAFLDAGPLVVNANIATLSITGCGTLGAGSTMLAGTITSATTGACNGTVLFNPAAAQAGVNCFFVNQTHPGSTNAIFQATPWATNGFTYTGTTVSADVISYACVAY